MILDYKNWRHLFKLDPAKQLSEKSLEKICLSGTDAIVIGGTDEITLEGVMNLYFQIKEYNIPIVLEISRTEAVIDGFDLYFVPFVLNTNNKKWLFDVQQEAIKQYGEFIPWNKMIAEGYCIMNENAKAFTFADCFLPKKEDVLAYARIVENLFRLPIFYLEYSGTFGDIELLKLISAELQKTQLFYGGGIYNLEQAEKMSRYADTIIVGNSLYTNLDEALETVKIKEERTIL